MSDPSPLEGLEPTSSSAPGLLHTPPLRPLFLTDLSYLSPPLLGGSSALTAAPTHSGANSACHVQACFLTCTMGINNTWTVVRPQQRKAHPFPLLGLLSFPFLHHGGSTTQRSSRQLMEEGTRPLLRLIGSGPVIRGRSCFAF